MCFFVKLHMVNAFHIKGFNGNNLFDYLNPLLCLDESLVKHWSNGDEIFSNIVIIVCFKHVIILSSSSSENCISILKCHGHVKFCLLWICFCMC